MSGLPGILQACLFTSVLATHHPVAAYSHPSFCRALPSPCLRQSPGSAVERSSRAHVAPRVFCLKEAHSRRVKGPRQTPFLAKTNHPTAWTDDAAFAGFLECNDPDVAAQLQVGQRSRMGARMLDHLQGVSKVDGSNGALRAIAHELAADEAIDSKEFFEAVEFYLRVRKRIRRPTILDLACGHGLCGLLFASLEPSVEKVLLVDAPQPASFRAILTAISRAAPWVRDKVEFCETDLFYTTMAPRDNGHSEGLAGGTQDGGAVQPKKEAGALADMVARIPSGDDRARRDEGEPRTWPNGGTCGCIAIHACGLATDRCLEIAAALGGPVAAMPCCYYGKRQLSEFDVPYALKRSLGKALAADIDRTYRLHRAGFHVDWATIPKQITPMNRILIATPRN